MCACLCPIPLPYCIFFQRTTVSTHAAKAQNCTIPTLITLVTGVCATANASSTYDEKPRKSVVSEFLSTLNEAETEELVRALSRRRVGRAAMLKTPVVVRSLTESKREGHRSAKSQQNHELSKVTTSSPAPSTIITLSTLLIMQITTKASHTKGRLTKMSNKLRSSEGRRKALQSMLVKVGGPLEISLCIRPI